MAKLAGFAAAIGAFVVSLAIVVPLADLADHTFLSGASREIKKPIAVFIAFFCLSLAFSAFRGAKDYVERRRLPNATPPQSPVPTHDRRAALSLFSWLSSVNWLTWREPRPWGWRLVDRILVVGFVAFVVLVALSWLAMPPQR